MLSQTDGLAASGRSTHEPSTQRRRLGAYYTTESVARVLVEWAVREPDDLVLDPSYGGCAFLRQSIDHLTTIGSPHPHNQVFGADIDGATATWRAHLVAQGVPKTSLHEGDFLLTHPSVELPLCSAVVGNPPYVRHHLLSTDQIEAYGRLRVNTPLSRRANAWAYFVLHSLSFLRPGGRLALLLPSSILHSGGYAGEVRAELSRRCVDVRFIRVRERLFQGVSEESVVLLAVTPSRGPSVWTDPRLVDVDDIDGLRHELASYDQGASPAKTQSPDRSGVVPGIAELVQNRIVKSGRFADVGSLARVRIGVVTGANSFFVRRPSSTWQEDGVSWKPIISRSAWLDRPVWTNADVARIQLHDLPSQLLLASLATSTSPGSHLADEVAAAEEAKLHERSHTSRRPVWYALPDPQVPHVFLPCMGRVAGRAVENSSNATSTNAIHHLWWTDNADPDTRFYRVLATWSDVWRLQGELLGRPYGGGVLKLEPASIRGMYLPLRASKSLHGDLLEAARSASASGNRRRIQEIANKLICLDLGIEDRLLDEIRHACLALEERRQAK
ncbi:HsdM family class I SAM-dependent methyltransferase [Pseudonocardia xinjiangensis]|uniref:N-6 DNA methylase n=1 Tax=Pseudonocardia xinjiangensis TaxID=75289 RepID=A0ABX1RI26_9PSEU|nr:N-6 DNA methylase [Pseudonocardia xinjiangensis]